MKDPQIRAWLADGESISIKCERILNIERPETHVAVYKERGKHPLTITSLHIRCECLPDPPPQWLRFDISIAEEEEDT